MRNFMYLPWDVSLINQGIRSLICLYQGPCSYCRVFIKFNDAFQDNDDVHSQHRLASFHGRHRESRLFLQRQGNQGLRDVFTLAKITGPR
jgi:hypothetical protein